MKIQVYSFLRFATLSMTCRGRLNAIMVKGNYMKFLLAKKACEDVFSSVARVDFDQRTKQILL